ncbi:MAG: ABC-F family ATP-binding cassette domain-containing protein [Chloroflexi bacterium]|nr:ABC-F family ATP-binding cassette domain-containing protein [Chloroflexota bacterium]
MAILSTQQLGLSFGAFDVFLNVTTAIQPGAKIGLVGPNGIGKTSLLLILCGLQEPSAGRVVMQDGLKLGYLRQEAMAAFQEATNTVWEEMMSVFTGVQALEARMAELEAQLSDETDSAALEAILGEYGEVQHEFETLGGYDYEVRTKATLQGLGFSEAEYATPLMQLSGGQKTRALLARLLLSRPDLLVLDEPTNHLDVGAVQWLERTLRKWNGALLIVSHDRYFLDSVADTIWEMRRTGIDEYKGNYSAYVRQRQDRQDYAAKVYEQEMERLRSELDFIKRNIARASTNGVSVGRLRRLSRDLAAIEEIGIMAYKASRKWSETGVGGVRMYTVTEAEAAIKAIVSPVNRLPKLAVRLKQVYRSGDYVLRTRDLRVGYPTRHLFDAGEIVLMRGDCAALIGDNGTGKTTLLKTLTGEIPALSGHVAMGSGLKVGYFAQAHDQMNLDNTVLDELIRHKDMPISEARNHLAQFLFRDEDVYKKVGMLSGGERGKLALAILTLDRANFLLLDEPTNHLDITAQEILQEALEHYEGTILLVSHDRYLIDRLATQIWNLEDGAMRLFKGTYQEYLAAEEAGELAAKAVQKSATAHKPARPPRPKKNDALARLEMQIHSAESSLKELDMLLERASAAQKVSAVQDLGRQYAEQQAALEGLMVQWAALAEDGVAVG